MQGEDLCRLVHEQGGHAEAFPVLEISALPYPPGRLAEQVEAADISVFVSRNAVECGISLVPATLLDGLRTRPCYCPGRETAGLLEALGFRQVHTAPGNRGSEALLELTGLQRVAGRSIIIFRGVGGRKLLGQELTERGAKVEYIEVYSRNRRVPGRGELSGLYTTRRPDCVEVSSRDGLESLSTLLRQELGGVPADLRVVVPAPRLLEVCAALDFQHPVLAPDATSQGLLDGFLAACQPASREGPAS